MVASVDDDATDTDAQDIDVDKLLTGALRRFGTRGVRRVEVAF